ncbi:MAG TPA: glycosyltransferase family 4 protein, partial [bacterium]|nr:glycosyltransferase family 4 protein [bacterium]
MKIAILAPIAWHIPPRKYGPWEQVAGSLADGLAERGIDVTLFATAQAQTKARLLSI